ncbi:MAG: phosphate ABC transporter permease subunit PstC [Chloroflexi bacterium]|nr:phosphate ABC transporter permease subunit PstC [Chloroflexota bacterium]
MKRSFPAFRSREFLVETLIRLTGVSAIFFVLLILIFLFREGAPALFEVPLGNLFGTRWYPIEDLYGILPLLLGSIWATVGAVVLAVPLGLATAVFIREIAPNWVREVLKPLIEVLAGIPSVVLGFLGWVIVAPLVQDWLGAPTGLTVFTGSLMLAYMALPTIISISEDAIDAVPKSYRDGALALGATHWQTIWRVVIPSARSGVLMAIMLGIGRAIGETMAVMMVTGNAPLMPSGLGLFFKPARTMTATIAAEMGEVAQGSTHYHVLFAIGLVLFLITLLVNIAASIVMLRQERGGGRGQLIG